MTHFAFVALIVFVAAVIAPFASPSMDLLTMGVIWICAATFGILVYGVFLLISRRRAQTQN